MDDIRLQRIEKKLDQLLALMGARHVTIEEDIEAIASAVARKINQEKENRLDADYLASLPPLERKAKLKELSRRSPK